MEKDCSCGGDISVGPWGNSTGKKWSFKAKRGIKQIIIRHGGIVDSLIFVGDTDDVSAADNSIKFGGNGGNRTDKIYIDFPSEYLTGISGTHGLHGTCDNRIFTLKFQTNQTEYGPFGKEQGSPFSFNPKCAVITGFHGRSDQYIEAIGVYIKPVCSVYDNVKIKEHSEIDYRGERRLLLRSAGPWGGAKRCGREWDDGVFSAVKVVHVHVHSHTGAISAVRFSYDKGDRTAFESPLHGGLGGDVVKKIEIDGTTEFLIGIEGFHGPIQGIVGLKAITSLTFHTNLGKYGPMGTEIGTYFTSINSLMDSNGKVLGFHGRSGAYLHAICVHTQYYF